jgi:hypothetical protein
MTEQKSIWSRILDLIVKWLEGSSTKTVNSNVTQPQLSEPLSGLIKEVGADYLAEKAGDLTSKYLDMLGGLSEVQRDYAYHIAILKAAESSELTMEEILELGDVINKCSELGITISEELSSFWNEFGYVAKEVGKRAANYGFKIGAKALAGYLPI